MPMNNVVVKNTIPKKIGIEINSNNENSIIIFENHFILVRDICLTARAILRNNHNIHFGIANNLQDGECPFIKDNSTVDYLDIIFKNTSQERGLLLEGKHLFELNNDDYAIKVNTTPDSIKLLFVGIIMSRDIFKEVIEEIVNYIVEKESSNNLSSRYQ